MWWTESGEMNAQDFLLVAPNLFEMSQHVQRDQTHLTGHHLCEHFFIVVIDRFVVV